MKKLLALVVTLAFLAPAFVARANGCYMCEGGGYVKYNGDDTFAKRKEAKEKFGCNVSGTTGSCSNPKGTVGFIHIKKGELYTKK